MNAHMELTSSAEGTIVIGIFAALVFGMLAFMEFSTTTPRTIKAWRWFCVFLALALISVGVVVAGTRMPREKIIHACVTGPVSLEQISTRYDIIKVDGSELTLRVR